MEEVNHGVKRIEHSEALERSFGKESDELKLTHDLANKWCEIIEYAKNIRDSSSPERPMSGLLAETINLTFEHFAKLRNDAKNEAIASTGRRPRLNEFEDMKMLRWADLDLYRMVFTCAHMDYSIDEEEPERNLYFRAAVAAARLLVSTIYLQYRLSAESYMTINEGDDYLGYHSMKYVGYYSGEIPSASNDPFFDVMYYDIEYTPATSTLRRLDESYDISEL